MNSNTLKKSKSSQSHQLPLQLKGELQLKTNWQIRDGPKTKRKPTPVLKRRCLAKIIFFSPQFTELIIKQTGKS